MEDVCQSIARWTALDLLLGGPWAIAQWMGPDMGTTGPTGGDPGGRHAPGNALEGGLNVGKEKIDVSRGAASRFQLGRPLCSPLGVDKIMTSVP
jgi:hypothetical protein